jgi:putative ABC transport system permease protein
VRLAPGAAQSFRDLPRETQRSLAARIDHLAAFGLPSGLPGVGEADKVHCLPVDEIALICSAQPEERIVTILAIEPLSEPVPRTFKRIFASRARRAWSGGLLADVLQDLRLALRMFARSPGFVAVTVLTLAIGIGGNTAIFSVFTNVFLNQLPFREGHRVVRLRDSVVAPSGEVRRYNMAPRNFLTIRDRSHVFANVVGMNGSSLTLTGTDEPERISGTFVSEGWAPALGLQPILGRVFSAEEEEAGDDADVVIISHALWQRRFGSDPEILGRGITLDGRDRTVIGVMPAGLNFPYDSDAWLPGTFDPHDGRAHDLNILARLRDGVTFEQAQQELNALARDLEAEFPATNANAGLSVEWARDNFIDEEDRVVLALLGAVAFLLLITCLNVTSLLTARFLSRQHEIGIRAVLGAGRMRQLRLFLTETLLLFLIGGAGGAMLTFWMKDYLVVLVPEVLRNQLALGEIGLSLDVLAFTVLLSLITGLVFGTAAALRGTSADLRSLLNAEGRTSSRAGGQRRMQAALVIGEVSMALVLLVGAGAMIGQFRQLQSKDLGFDAGQLVTMRIDLRGSRYSEGASRANLVQELEAAIGTVPGVVSVGTTTVNPICCGDWGANIDIEGRERPADGSSIIINHRFVTPRLFEAMGIPLLRGRIFNEQDNTRSSPVTIIDSRMAARFWPDEDPLGKRVRRFPDGEWRTVVGVAAEVRDHGDYNDTWYLPYFQDPSGRSTDGLHIMLRAEGDRSAVIRSSQSAIWEVDPNLAIYGVELMDELYASSLSQDRLGAVVAGLFATFALVLAAFGIYGLMSYLVGEQTREIGTRMALGAQPGDVLRMILGDSIRLVIAGLGLGLAGTLILKRVLAHLFVDAAAVVTPGVILGVAVLLAFATLAATYLPARRAARLAPVIALRG